MEEHREPIHRRAAVGRDREVRRGVGGRIDEDLAGAFLIRLRAAEEGEVGGRPARPAIVVTADLDAAPGGSPARSTRRRSDAARTASGNRAFARPSAACKENKGGISSA
jgi:hypothetical protein